MGETTINVCYSLPRLISMGIQCSFCAYMWELYTAEFGWTQAEYGFVSLTYSLTQVISFLLLGLAFNFGINRLNDDKKLEASKWILIAGTITHWRKLSFYSVTYVLLIFLPIKWHGIHVPGIRFLSGIITVLLFIIAMLFKIPLFIITIPLKILWGIIGIFVRVPLYFYIKLIRGGSPKWPLAWRMLTWPFKCFDTRFNRAPVLESIPPPTCSACCNTTCCNVILRRLIALMRWFGTRRCRIYLITAVHGIGVSAHELSNKAIESYIYKDFVKVLGAINMNLSFLFISNLVVYIIFALLKLFIRTRAFFAVTFYSLSIGFGLGGIPALICFYMWTQRVDAETSKGIETPVRSAFYLAIKWLCLTIFHSTVVFLIFSGGALTNYVGIFVMGGSTGMISFGNLVLFGALNCTSWLQMIFGKVAPPASDTVQMLIMGACILGQAAVYYVFTIHDYVILVFNGIVNSIFVLYTNVMLGVNVANDFRGKDWKWIFFGGFYSGTNAAIFPSMKIMFDSFGQDRTRDICWKSVRFSYHYCFPTVYRNITGLFQILNIVSYYGYYIAYNYDKDLATFANGILSKLKAFKDATDDLNTKATTFSAHNGVDAELVRKFKAASAALEVAGQAFKDFGEELEKVVKEPNCGGLATKASAFQDAATSFKTASGPANEDTNGNNFYALCKKLNDASLQGITGTSFDNVKDKFGHEGDDSSGATISATRAFNDITGISDCDKLQQQAGNFKAASTAFASGAKLFNDAAKQVQDTVSNAGKLNTNDIKTKFQTAATSFQSSANTLFTAIKPIVDAMSLVSS